MAKNTGAEIIRVFLVHPQSLFRESLGQVLATEPEIVIAGHCESLEAAADALRQAPVQVLLVDLTLGLAKGVSLRTAGGARTRVLALADTVSPAQVVTALNLGFSGVFFIDGALQSLVQAIRIVASGSAWLDRRVISVLADGGRGALQPARDFPNALSRREEEVLVGICEGMSNRAIAEKLGIPESAVKGTLRHLFHKARVHARSQLVRVYLESSQKTSIKGRAG